MKDLFYDWAGGNVWLFHAINAQQPSWLDHAMWWTSRIGDYRNFPLFLGVWLLAAWYWRRIGNTEKAIRTWLHARRFMVAAAIALVLASGLKLGLDLPRPVAELGSAAARVLVSPEQHYSLPSGHSTFVMLVAVSLWPLCAWPYRLGLVAFALCVGVSRVWLGAHFPADVVAGYATALVSAFLAAHLVPSPKRPVVGTVEKSTAARTLAQSPDRPQ